MIHSQLRAWLLALAVPLGVILSVSASVTIAERNTAKQLQRQCSAVLAIVQAFEETPPPTVTGKNVQQAYIDQYRLLHCPPEG